MHGHIKAVRFVGILAVVAVLGVAANWIYQVSRKPTELLAPVSRNFTKTPEQTWREYAGVFRQHATQTITPPLLAALAQVEASGNPLVLTYWRWSWMAHPLEMYRPASSAVGMYQMTDGTFEEARHYCIRNHAVIRDTVRDQEHTCPLTRIYTRLLPSDAVELTSAYLDVHVARIVTRVHATHVSLSQKQDLATVIHLCGAGAAEAYARRGFKFNGQRCGDHDPRVYLARVNAMKAVFARLAVKEARLPPRHPEHLAEASSARSGAEPQP